MERKSDELYIKLKQGPAVLFLGQDYLKLDTGKDPFLTDVINKFGPENAKPNTYTQIMEGIARDDVEASLAWMYHRCERMSIPEWLKIVAGFSWSHVYTSAIDTLWYRAFRSEWRELFPLFEEKFKPIDIRSRTQLHCTFLFGCINRPSNETAERPPLSKREFRSRRPEALVLTRRLPEIITPFGTLVIEGYAALDDWFDLNDMFFHVVDMLGPGQVHLFSARDKIRSIPEINEYIEEGKFIPYSESLAQYLSQSEEKGQIKLGLQPDDKRYEHRVQVDGKILTVPSDIWNLTTRSATILDDKLLLGLSPLSDDKKYHEFRNFLAESSVRPVWSGYGRGFAFKRYFEQTLRGEIEKQFKSRSLQKDPIILHGQSGTGKSIALGALAYDIRKQRKCPVLFIERRSQKPILTDIDIFCRWAEDNGAPFTLVIWDGMTTVEEYSGFLHYLVSRGRKAILVGSCYYIKDTQQKTNFIEAPAMLQEKRGEISQFKEFLNTIDLDLSALLNRRINQLEQYFLVMLYRLLPPTRSGIRSNLVREFNFAEQQISSEATKQTTESPTSFAYALLEAGLINEEDAHLSGIKEIGGERMTEVQEIIGLVMVPGRFGLKIPLELIMRSLHKSWVNNLVNILSEVDIFRWYEDSTGNILIGPRHPLEANLIVQSRLGTAGTEIDFARKLILEIKADSLSDNAEIHFIVELLRSMGPNGEHADYFSPNFLDLANTLQELREKRGIENPRIMLQEASLLREWVASKDKAGISLVNGPTLLDRAEYILKKALKLLEGDSRGEKLRSAIYVELGTNLASRTRQTLNLGTPDIPINLYDLSKENLYKAISISPGDFHPFDVLFWMSKELISSKFVETSKKAEITADILNAFSIVDPDDFDAVQKVRYYGRRYDLGTLLSQTEMSEESFNALIMLGSKVGYYLRAYSMVRDIPIDTQLSLIQVKQLEQALFYLEQHREEISGDGRCLNLLLRTWWMSKTGKPILFGERQTVPFNINDWIYAHKIVSDLLQTDELHSTILLNYLKGVITFHLGQYNNSVSIFRELEREAEKIGSRKRIIRSYLLSTPEGKPREFQGNVSWVNDDRTRGEVDVEELRFKIRFIPLDFLRGRELSKNDPLGTFHIAFNFIGPIADPPGYLK